ncbi:MAG: DUF4235 domain-containing protein [Gammaproteobacteria bacterium]
MYRLLAYACIVSAGLAARNAFKKTWEFNSGREVPNNPAEPDVRWSEALIWSMCAGVAVGLARTITRGLLPERLQRNAAATRQAPTR